MKYIKGLGDGVQRLERIAGHTRRFGRSIVGCTVGRMSRCLVLLVLVVSVALLFVMGTWRNNETGLIFSAFVQQVSTRNESGDGEANFSDPAPVINTSSPVISDLPIWKQRFEYLIEPSLDNRTNCDLVVLVTTRPNAIQRRQTIRNTWGGRFEKSGHVQVFFIFGRGILESSNSKDSISENLTKEAEENQDILLVDFQDTYANLSLKSYLGFSYAVDRYRTARFFMKADDDVVLYSDNILKYMARTGNKKEKNFYCHQYENAPVRRNPNDTKL